MEDNYYYQIYGLKIKSLRAIDLLPEQPDCIADVDVKWTTIAEDIPGNGFEWQPGITRQLLKKERTRLFKSETINGTYLKICFITQFGVIAITLDPAKRNLWIL